VSNRLHSNHHGVNEASNQDFGFVYNSWLWDLSLSCESEESLESCQCNFAAELMDLGRLTCDDAPLCPSTCKICNTCLQILGCQRSNAHASSSQFSKTLVFLIASAAGILLLGAVIYAARKRQRAKSVGGSLMGGDETLLQGYSSDEPSVWLAPDLPPAQFEPSHLAAVASSGSSMSSTADSDPPPFCPQSLLPELHSVSSSVDNVWLAPVD
jgi:hypothetical protein